MIQFKKYLFAMNLTRFYTIIFFTLASICAGAQGRMVLNGATVNLTQGAALVMANPNSNAITRNSGQIISEGENNRVIWRMGTTTGTYTIPFGYGTSNYIPLTFTKAAGTGAGYFSFSTYHTGWQNSTQLPTGITNFNNVAGADNSAYATDRFWSISPVGYTTVPALSNVIFTYLDSEFASPNNTTTESRLTAQRWNTNLSSWTDYNTGGVVNTTANTVTIASIPSNALYTWWSVAYPGNTLHWVSATNSTWNNTNNWSLTAGGAGGAGVPTGADAVYFDNVRNGNCTLVAAANAGSLTVNTGYTGTIAQNAQTITVGAAASFASGTFNGGTGSMTIGSNLIIAGAAYRATTGTTDIKGNFTFSSGSFTHNSGIVRFSGTTGTQRIDGGAAATFHNIQVANTSATPGLSIDNNANQEGILTLAANTTVDADGASNTAVFKLLSTGDVPTKDAAIGVLPTGAAVTGNVTVQRYMSVKGASNGRIYRYIASPVQNATIADLQNEIPVTGPFTGSSTCSGCNRNASMFYYNESVVTDINGDRVANSDDGYVRYPVASNTETMVPGLGYATYIRGNLMTTASWDVRGVINSANNGALSFPVTYTNSGNLANDGWNLVGNPFPSTIDWNASGWTKTNMNAAVYIRDNGNTIGQFAAWNGAVGTNGGSQYIAIGQGFWVKASGTGTPVLRATETVKAPGVQTVLYKAAAPQNVLRVTLTQDNVRDEAVIHFRDGVTEGFDVAADALKMPNSTFNLASVMADGRALAINSIPTASCNADIPLTLDNVKAGTYTLKFSDIESFTAGATVTLTDKFTNAVVDVTQTAYDFTVTTDPLSFGAGRFRVSIERKPVNTDFKLTTQDICGGQDATLVISSAMKNITYTAYLNGRQVLKPVKSTGADIKMLIPRDSLKNSSAVITVKTSGVGCYVFAEQSKVIQVVPVPAVTAVTGATICREGQATLQATGAPADGRYNWYDADGKIIDNNMGASLTTPVISKTRNYWVAAVNALGCEGARQAVTAEVIRYDDVTLTTQGDTLVSNYAEGNAWYLNNTLLSGVEGATYIPQQSGTYTVQVNVQGCTTTASRDYLITTTEVPVEQLISVYPNPVVDVLQVHIPVSSAYAQYQSLDIVHGSGKVVGRVSLLRDGQTLKGQFNFQQLPAGVYILKSAEGTQQLEIKIVKE